MLRGSERTDGDVRLTKRKDNVQQQWTVPDLAEDLRGHGLKEYKSFSGRGRKSEPGIRMSGKGLYAVLRGDVDYICYNCDII